MKMNAFDGTTGDATLAQPFYDPIINEMPQRALFMRSLIPTESVPYGDRVQYLRESIATNKAAAVAAGGLKPTSIYTTEMISSNFSVLAHLSEALDRSLLMDAPALGSFIHGQLRLGVLLEEERQILLGNGTAPNFEGFCRPRVFRRKRRAPTRFRTRS